MRRDMLRAALALPFMAVMGIPARAASPPRLVALDLLATELLVSLGVNPVAVANVALYRRLVAKPALADEVMDLGPLLEPNAELLQAIRPDAIVMAAWQAGPLRRLREIAPLVPLDTASAGKSGVAQAIGLLVQLSELTGRKEAAQALASQLEATFAEARTALAGRTRRSLYVGRFAQDGRTVALFGGTGLIGDSLFRLGLVNAWGGRVNGSGVISVGIDQLAGDPEARIVHFDRGEETSNALARLTDNPLWRALPAVKADRLTMMPVIYPNGGVASAMRFARQLAESLPHDA
ncbi:ABC transporter substrate-binding protein [Labrys neptuniae]|uniref:ABC transporter substrate-binding protein n=1 Tax=Labrys neptuniae TaxID=376174 RepID=UPI0028907283|nr:ABC transporter substrate-binding protein [Labrys neptuniae]MDT3380295.1 ABC transporter substrate-binding protein [Labrys neptuniae]